MAERYGTVVRIVVPGDTVPMGGHGDGPWPGTVAGDAVYQIWRSVTGRELPPAARQEFASRAAALSLAEVDRAELTVAARRVFGVFGKLLLADWREEIDEPGLAGLRAVSGEWEGNTESAALTLRTEIAHLIESALTARDQPRPVLRRRLGLDGDQRLTLGALGAEYGLSRERIRQLQQRQLQQLARRTGRSRRGAVLREVIRGLADRGGESPGAALHEIAGLVFPDAGPDVRLHTVAVLAGYPARVRAQLAAQAAQARHQRAAARREQAALARAGKSLRRLLAAAQWPPQPAPESAAIRGCPHCGQPVTIVALLTTPQAARPQMPTPGLTGTTLTRRAQPV